MKIAVTGVSGFVGRNFIKRLRQTDIQIVALTHRNNFESDDIGQIESRKADIHDIESLNHALKDVDVVIHLVGIIAETKKLTFEKTVIGGTRNLVKACLKNNVKKIIYISALGTSQNAETKYHKSKWAAEEIIQNSGIEYVILRPSVIFGEDDKFINMLADMVKKAPVTPIIGDGLYLMQPIYVDDLAEIMVQSIDNEKAKNKTIDIGGPEQISYKAIIALLRKIINIRRVNLYIPIWLAKVGASILEIFKKPSPVTVDQIKMLVAGNICDTKELGSIFKIKLTTLEDGINKYLR